MLEYLQALKDAEFTYPFALYFLYLLIPFLLFACYTRRKESLAHLLRAGSMALLLLAFADPTQTESSSTSELVAVFDVSASISEKARRSLGTAALEFSKQDNLTLRVLPFAKTAAVDAISVNQDTSLESFLSSIDDAASSLDLGESNLAEGIRAALRSSNSSSILVLSDARETEGDSESVIAESNRKGVSLFPLLPSQKDFSSEKLSISDIQAPLTVPSGTRTEVGVSLRNDYATEQRARVSLYLEDEKLLSQDVTIAANQERLLQLKTPTLTDGLKRLRARLEPLSSSEDVEMSEKYRWISVKEESKILMLSGDKEDDRLISSLIREKGYGVEAIIADGRKRIPTELDKYSTVIFNNVAKGQLPKGFLEALERYAAKGGGVLLIGGDKSFGLGGYISTPLERISPLKFLPPQTEKKRLTSSVVLVLDKSGSMVHQNKITAAKKAALLSVQTLKDEDYVSVIGFDHAPFVMIDLQKVAEAKIIAEGRLRNLTAAGKTNLLPALAQARQMLRTVSTSRKHIIVLSDGKFPLSSDQYVQEINRLRQGGVSVSAVALGREADIPFMKLLAKYGKGAFYETLDPSRLPQIFVEDIKVTTGEKTMQENKNFPVGVGPGGLNSTTVSRYPALRGFVETRPKKGSIFELVTKRRKKAFPLLASWNYKKGKVTAFASDANGRWSAPWVRWNNFPTFWGDLIDSTRDKEGDKAGDIEFDLRYKVARKNIELDLSIFDSKLLNSSAPAISAKIVTPNNEPERIVFNATAKGRFSSDIENARPGDYKIEIAYGDTQLTPIAIHLPGELFGEAPGRGVDSSKLERLSALSGGLMNPEPAQVPVEQRKLEEAVKLFIPLVALAFVLVMLEAFLREIWLKRRK